MTKIITDAGIAANEIKKGNVTGLPTETVYGLGANALNENAVLKIYEVKNRPEFNPIIVHVYDLSDFEKYAEGISDKVYMLADKFSPGPLTFVLKKKNIIPDIVTSGNDSVGLRIPSHPVFREVLKLSQLPVAAPSANVSGKISPTSAEDVLADLNEKIDYILDGGKCGIGIESTVISFLDDRIKILRPGFVTLEEIESVVGKIDNEPEGKLLSPGRLKSHYAPVTPLYRCESIDKLKNRKDKNIGFLDFSKYDGLREIALNLFSDLRRLDKGNHDFIVYRNVPDEGIGLAINDRLRRAASGEVSIVNDVITVKKN